MDNIKAGNSSKRPKLKAILFQPSTWLLAKKLGNSRLPGLLYIFLILGIIFQQLDPFPYFYLFFAIFLLIGNICLFAERHYCEEMQEIILGTQMPSPAKYFMDTTGESSFLFLLVPLSTVALFGAGGCSIFGALTWTPTLIWMLIYFAIVVYISMIGYLQYLFLAVYVRKLSLPGERLTFMNKKGSGFVPADGQWIQRLTKLTHCYRSLFFTLGTVYILAFAAFCYLPAMKADRNAPAFFVLWLTIFAAIVLTFPAVSFGEWQWIKRIVENLKSVYISDLEKECAVLSKSDPSALPALIRSIRIRQILDSKDYPVLSFWSVGYAAVLSLVNFLASIFSIAANFQPIINALQQIS